MIKTKIIATVGPSSMHKNIIHKMDQAGVDMFRINMSHTDINDFQSIVEQLQRWTQKPICPDTEGAQIRSTLLCDALNVNNHEVVTFVNSASHINPKEIGITGGFIGRLFSCGDLIKIDFNGVLIQIIESNNEKVIGQVITGGVIGNNKGISVDQDLTLASFTEKDNQMIELSKDMGLDIFYLSFCSNGDDVKEMRNRFDYDIQIISKVESKKGLYNLESICKESDAVLIDRGDLSRDVPLEKIPFAQKYILDEAKSRNTHAYVATNLMENMINNSKPTRAEVNDIRATLNDGADGLVLAAETAIGKYPVECVRIMSRIINEVENHQSDINIDTLFNLPSDRVVAPHGGNLIQQFSDELIINDAYTLIVDKRIIMDAVQIANGTYSPISCFMDMANIYSVLTENQIGGEMWTLPIIFQIDEKMVKKIPHNGKIYLKPQGEKEPFCVLNNLNIEKFKNKSEVAKLWFETNDLNHPGVNDFMKSGDYILSGQPFLLNKYKNNELPYNLTPKQTREVFDHNGWHKIIGFHTRNICHRGHEFIQMTALEKYNADAIFITPVTGQKKIGDFTSDVIITSYHELIRSGIYDPFGVLLNSFNTHSRYSGPREAVFTALCRKNYGCSHFIVGRDHTGVGNYYNSDASQKIFSKFDTGMTIICVDEIVYDSNKNSYIINSDNKFENIQKLSASIIRDCLKSNKSIPNYLTRPVVANILKIKLRENPKLVFV